MPAKTQERDDVSWLSFGLGMVVGFILGGELMYRIIKRSSK